MSNNFDQWQSDDHEYEVRDNMHLCGVSIGDLVVDSSVSRSMARRWLKSVDNVNDWLQIVDQVAERKTECFV